MKTAQPPAAPASRHLLTDFLNANSSDPATRTMVATTLVLIFWQTGGRAVTPQLPSTLLINAGGAETDPLDAFIDRHGLGLGHKEMPKTGTGSYVGGTPANARVAMLNSIRARDKLGETTPNNQAHIQSLEKRFHDAQATGFGSVGSGPYTRMWDDDMGWITPSSGDILLRFDQAADRKAFRKDVLDHPDRLLHPLGVNPSLRLAMKSLAVSGTLPPAEWNANLVRGVMELGLPMFFLPHVVKEPLIVNNPLDFALLTTTFSNSRFHGRQPVVTPIHLPVNDHCHRYEKLLRQRLYHLPGGYEFSVLRAVRELEEVCYRIARHTAAPGSSAEEIMAIFVDLNDMAFRGIVISIASLAYHGLGFDPGCPHAEAAALLRHLRDSGPVSRRDLQRRFQSFTATQRDQVLERLAAEGLVVLDAKKVAAVPLADFIRSIHVRPECL